MPALLGRIGLYVIATGIALDAALCYFGNFEYHFPLDGTFSVFLLPLGVLLILASGVAKLNANSDRRGVPSNVSDVRIDMGMNCWPRDPNSLPKVRYTVFQGGRRVAQAEAPQSYYLPFHAQRTGYYSLDIQFLSGPNCLDGQNTNVFVAADSSYYDDVYTFLRWLAVGLVPPGLVVVVRALVGSKAARFEISATSSPGQVRRHPWPLRPRFSSLPSRGLVSMSLAIPLILVMWTLGLRWPEKGFWVSVTPMSRSVKVESWDAALVLRIDSKRRLYLNSTPISRRNLTEALTIGLARRAERVVYVDGSSDLEYQDVMDAIDAVRGVRARVILLTHHTKHDSR